MDDHFEKTLLVVPDVPASNGAVVASCVKELVVNEVKALVKKRKK